MSTTASERVELEGDPLPGEPFTDLGNARRLVAAFGHRLRHVPAWGRWLVWDGRRWSPDDTREAARCAKAVGRGLQRASVDADNSDARKALRRAADRAESAQGVRATLELAASESQIAIRPDQLDADPHLLNVANGTLDLRTCTLADHDPTQLLSKVTRAAYTPGATRTGFDAFLSRVQPDEDMRAYLSRLLGHTLEGRVTENLLPVFQGAGANGKSTLLDLILDALGDYAITADPDLLIDTGHSHPTGVADLLGRRLAVTHETDSGRRLAEGTVKRLTGGDRIKARYMRQDFFEFDPSHSVIMVTNHRPVVRGDDEGIWRRLRVIPFEVVVPEAERDPHLRGRLTLELDGILTWLITGHQHWHRHGLQEPATVTTATSTYRSDSDLLARWIEEQCLTAPDYWTHATDLFHAWQKWARAEGLDPGTQHAFGRQLGDRGFQKAKKGTVIWRGLTLAATDPDTP